MENNTEINKIIAKRLAYYRKEAGLTQAELAEKISYSDKSVSKWESGNGIPDVYTLLLLAELYGVTLNDLVCAEEPVQVEKKPKNTRLWIMLLSSGIVWLAATVLFTVLQIAMPDAAHWWLSFIYAVVANSIVLIVFSGHWRYKFVNFLSVSALVWSAIVSIYLTARFISERLGTDYSALWLVFMLGIPLQVLEIFWGLFRANKGKRRIKHTVEQDEGAAEPKEKSAEE